MSPVDVATSPVFDPAGARRQTAAADAVHRPAALTPVRWTPLPESAADAVQDAVTRLLTTSAESSISSSGLSSIRTCADIVRLTGVRICTKSTAARLCGGRSAR